MTQSEKLEALVERAISKGWNVEGEFKHIHSTLDDELIVTFSYRNRYFVYSATSIIFNHDFANALFGGHTDPDIFPPSSIGLNQAYRISGWKYHLWKYHLQQAVIADNPIDYMYKEVFEK